MARPGIGLRELGPFSVPPVRRSGRFSNVKVALSVRSHFAPHLSLQCAENSDEMQKTHGQSRFSDPKATGLDVDGFRDQARDSLYFDYLTVDFGFPTDKRPEPETASAVRNETMVTGYLATTHRLDAPDPRWPFLVDGLID
jgi:hypothetical protein